jgi:hypothetical protein
MASAQGQSEDATSFVRVLADERPFHCLLAIGRVALTTLA